MLKKVILLNVILLASFFLSGCDKSLSTSTTVLETTVDPHQNIDVLMGYLIDNDFECTDHACLIISGTDGGGIRVNINFELMLMTVEIFSLGTTGLDEEIYIPMMSYKLNYKSQDLYIYKYNNGTLDYSTELCACNLETDTWLLREGECLEHPVSDYKNQVYTNILKGYLMELGMTYEDIIIN